MIGDRIAIVGAGAAGMSAARTLRRLAFAGEITLIDGDPAGAYERPPLSKAALMQSETLARDFALLTQDETAELKLKTHFGDPVADVQPNKGVLQTKSGRRFEADKILLAVGGSACRIPIPGSDAPGVFTLRDFSDVQVMRARLAASRHVTVVGGGLIGAECVASMLKLDREVLWLDAAPEPLSHILPAPIANALVQAHLAAGAELVPAARIASFEFNDAGVTAVQFDDGSRRPTDMVVLGVGMAPRLDLAERAGLTLAAGGVRVDDRQETSATGVFAAGDLAALPAGGEWKRQEHWRAAEVQGEAAAHGMLNLPYSRPDSSWFWSDQGDHHVEMVGRKGARSVQRVGEGTLATFEFSEGELVGAASLNDPNAVRVAVRLLRDGKSPSETALADPRQDLRKLMRA